MEENIFEVVGEGVEAPELIVDPEGSGGKRVVLLGGAWDRPELQEALPQFESPLHVDDPFVVVEDQGAWEAGPVNDDGTQHEGQGTEPKWLGWIGWFGRQGDTFRQFSCKVQENHGESGPREGWVWLG